MFHRSTPLIPIRGVHLDLKGLPPTPTRLLEFLDRFAAARFNCILVEWEDSFPWSVDPRFRSPTAYTSGEVEQFHRRALQLGFQPRNALNRQRVCSSLRGFIVGTTLRAKLK